MTEALRFLAALKGQPVDKTPVWLMRQAGRYLPEYRALRAEAGSFLALCQNPDWATEVTLQPLRRFDLDAAIIFSDILVVPMAMGAELTFQAGEGPRFANPVRTDADWQRLAVAGVESLEYVPQALRQVKQEIAGKTALIGFAGSPWTVATYLVEGGSSKDFRHIKRMLYQQPDTLHGLLQRLCDATKTYLSMQVAGGADALMIFDTWGGILNTPAYQTASLHYLQQLSEYVKSTHPDIPVILFTKGGARWLEDIAATGCDGVGLDWTISLGEARERLGDKVTLQGNLDPALLYASPDRIEAAVKEHLASYGHGHRHIFNLGHGVLQETPPEHVEALVEAVHAHSAAYHQEVKSPA